MPAYFGFSLIPATMGVGAPGHQLILSMLARCRHAGCTGDPCSLPPRSWVGIYVPYAGVFWSLCRRICTKAQKSWSWCVCETTAPRHFMSTLRRPTPQGFGVIRKRCCSTDLTIATELDDENWWSWSPVCTHELTRSCSLASAPAPRFSSFCANTPA